jgi:hypothetical protein
VQAGAAEVHHPSQATEKRRGRPKNLEQNRARKAGRPLLVSFFEARGVRVLEGGTTWLDQRNKTAPIKTVPGWVCFDSFILLPLNRRRGGLLGSIWGSQIPNITKLGHTHVTVFLLSTRLALQRASRAQPE